MGLYAEENGVTGGVHGAPGEGGYILPKNQSVFGSIAMSIVMENIIYFRPVSDYRAVSATIEQVALPMPNLESVARLFVIETLHCTLDVLQGYW